MPTIRIRPRAERDLVDIGIAIADENPRAAVQLIDAITARFHVLANAPMIGAARNELRSGIRMFPVRGYLIFYFPLPDGIEVARVIYGRRSYRGLL